MAAFAAGLAAGALLGYAAAAWFERRRGRVIGRFFSFAAHEVNTPITAVNMTILNLLSGVFGDVAQDQLQWIEMMREQVVRLAAMVGEMRDLIHLQMGDRLQIHREAIDVAELVETGLRAIRFGCGHAAIPLDSSVPGGLPAVFADPDRLPRTLSSVLFHARKFRNAGPLVFRAGLGEAGRIEILVEFTGPPLSAEDAERSLDLYFPARQRGDQSMTATGLGLGILRDLMRLQDGDLTYETDGKGLSRLRLLIPLKAT